MYESKTKSEETDHLFQAILSLQSVEECYRFFDDLCTINEVLAMAQRFESAVKLYQGNTFSNITSETGVSSATLTRVNRCLKYGAGGYKTILDRRFKKEE